MPSSGMSGKRESRKRKRTARLSVAQKKSRQNQQKKRFIRTQRANSGRTKCSASDRSFSPPSPTQRAVPTLVTVRNVTPNAAGFLAEASALEDSQDTNDLRDKEQASHGGNIDDNSDDGGGKIGAVSAVLRVSIHQMRISLNALTTTNNPKQSFVCAHLSFSSWSFSAFDSLLLLFCLSLVYGRHGQQRQDGLVLPVDRLNPLLQEQNSGMTVAVQLPLETLSWRCTLKQLPLYGTMRCRSNHELRCSDRW